MYDYCGSITCALELFFIGFAKHVVDILQPRSGRLEDHEDAMGMLPLRNRGERRRDN